MKGKKWLSILTICFVMILSCGLLSACGNNEEQFTPYTIVFHTNGGNAIEDLYVDNADAVIPTTTKGQYPFKGWYLDNETFAKEYTIKTKVSPDSDGKVHVYAKWSQYVIKTVYYESEYEIDKEYETFEESIYLYQPNIVGKYFLGWYTEATFDNKVDDLLTNEMVTSTNNYIRLYAKYEDKEIDNITIVGSVKTEYEYGEEFDANGAKLLITYMDKGQPTDTVNITQDMVSNFNTKQPYNSYYITQWNGVSDYYSDNLNISYKSKSWAFQYRVHTDIKNIVLNENLVFTHGDYDSAKLSNATITYTTHAGNTYTHKLKEDPTVSDENSFIKQFYLSNYKVSSYGECTGLIRFHYKTFEFSYIVLPREDIVSAKIETRIYKGSKISLSENYSSLKIYNSKNESFYWDNIPSSQILVDIDTSTFGSKVAKVIYNGKEIEIPYYVMDYDEIVSAKVLSEIYVDMPPTSGTITIPPHVHSYIVEFTLSDNTTFQEKLEWSFEIGVNTNYIETIDTSTTGTKSTITHYHNRRIQTEYTVLPRV